MTSHEAIEALEKMQSQIVHGSRVFSDIANVVKALRNEHAGVEALMDIVEGCRGKRWSADGIRLVDTPEWCRLYTLRCRVNDLEEPR